MIPKVIMAIDPGKFGAIAYFVNGEFTAVYDVPLTKSEVNIPELVKLFSIDNFGEEFKKEDVFVFVEDVNNFPGAGAKQMRTFGWIVGLLDGIINTYGYRYVKVKPKEWQKLCWTGIPQINKSNGKTDTKAMSYIAFQRLFPGVNINDFPKSKDGRIDAVLIGYYGHILIGTSYV
jgi:hypothetical protein